LRAEYGVTILPNAVSPIDPAVVGLSGRVGFVGLGHLGAHLAASLLRAGHQLTVTDLDRGAAASLLAVGAAWADDPAGVAGASDVVITCLPSPAVINAVITAPNGVLAGFAGRAGTWIDMSTNDRNETLRLGALVCEAGANMLEAPVTGGVHRAAAGQITVLVGGDESVFDSHRDLLGAVGNPVLYMGPLGSAALIKVITNMLAFVNLVSVGEALMLAKRGGLDLGKAFEAIKESSGNSFVHETESQVILNGSYNINFTMDLACKDLSFATQFGRELGVPLDLAGLTEQTFIRARSAYGGGAWSSQVVKLLEDALGTDLRAPGFPDELPPS
jgi:3-hydroxyisobutyrate dehydrogenase